MTDQPTAPQPAPEVCPECKQPKVNNAYNEDIGNYHRCAPEQKPDWWCCNADYPNHETSCVNAPAQPAGNEPPEGFPDADEVIERWLQSMPNTPMPHGLDNLSGRITAALCSARSYGETHPARLRTPSDRPAGEQDSVWQLLNVRTAFLESAEKECDELREALRSTADHELDDGTLCWCIDRPTKSAHADYCQKARRLLADPQPTVSAAAPVPAQPVKLHWPFAPKHDNCIECEREYEPPPPVPAQEQEVDSGELHTTMTPHEYATWYPKGWYEVCKNVDGLGNVGVRHRTSGVAGDGDKENR